MAGFNYPIRVIKKKMKLDNYKPFAVDCSTGSSIQLENNKVETTGYIALYFLFLALALGLLYFTLFQPIKETDTTRANVEQSLSTLGFDDASLIKELKQKGEIVSENVSGNLITLVIQIKPEYMKASLELAFKLTGLKEVSTDGKTLAVQFISSEK